MKKMNGWVTSVSKTGRCLQGTHEKTG